MSPLRLPRGLRTLNHDPPQAPHKCPVMPPWAFVLWPRMARSRTSAHAICGDGQTRERTIVRKSGSAMATRSWPRSIMLSRLIDWSARWKQYGSPVPSSPKAIQASR